jgi:hypothetical protein
MRREHRLAIAGLWIAGFGLVANVIFEILTYFLPKG